MLNYQMIRDEVREIEECWKLQHDDEAAADKERALLYDFVDFVVDAFGGDVPEQHAVGGHYLAVWATEIRKVKDMEFRRG